MFRTSPGCHNQCKKSSKLRGQFQLAALRVLLNNSLQFLKEHTEGCDKNLFKALFPHRFLLHPFTHFSHQLNHYADSDSLVTSSKSRFFSSTPNDHKDNDA